jgi:hypothetical protein
MTYYVFIKNSTEINKKRKEQNHPPKPFEGVI